MGIIHNLDCNDKYDRTKANIAGRENKVEKVEMDILLNWLDLIWVPIAFLLLHKGQRFKAIMFILTCVFSLRLQIELMEEIGYSRGILPLLDFPLLYRGYIAYGTIIAVFLILSRFSREKDHFIYIAAAITVFIAAFCISSFVLVL